MTTDCMLDRRRLIKALMRQRGDSAVVTGLGAPTYDCFAAGDSNLNFYLWGGMGGAALIGLGLALAQPARRVLVITGDGEILMGLGSLATIAVQSPKNLAICIIDNQRYGETGMQETHTEHGVDLCAIANGAGFQKAKTVFTKKQLIAVIPILYQATGPVLVNFKVNSDSQTITLPERDGPTLKHRFRKAVTGL